MHNRQTLNQIADLLLATPDALRATLVPLTPAQRRARPAAGGWSMIDVVIHLLSGDGPAFADRIRFIVEDRGPELPRFDPDAQVDAYTLRDAPLDALLDRLARQRRTHGAWLRTLEPALLARTVQYEPFGQLAAWDFVTEWPYHDQAHLAQIGALLRQQLLPGMSPAMRRALGHGAA